MNIVCYHLHVKSRKAEFIGRVEWLVVTRAGVVGMSRPEPNGTDVLLEDK